MPGKAEMGEQANRTGWPVAKRACSVVAHRIGQRPRGITEVVAAAELGQVAAIDRPQPAPGEHRVEFIQVKQQLRDGVTECMRMRLMPAMHHLPM